MQRNRTPKQGTILVVDDEAGLREVLATYLQDEGFSVLTASDGAAAVESALRDQPDLIILDLNLPKISGVEVLRRVRVKSNVPVIMLSSRVGEVDRIVGLELGADDYVGKPFSPREVVARVKSVLRRSGPSEPVDVQRIGALELDRAAHEVRRGGATVDLTPTEYRILDVLATQLGRAFTRDQVLAKVSADVKNVYDRTLDRHIANLRQKIEDDPSRPAYVVTVSGVGYKLVSPK